MDEDRRRAFKLRDLMVAVFVVAVLLSLPLSQMFNPVRCTGGRRSWCQNNIRQIALGLMGFANAKGAFPNAGTFFDDPAVHGGDPERSQIHKAFVDPHGAIKDPDVLLRSWVVDILPYIDGQELYNNWNYQTGYLSEGLSASSPGNATLGDTPIGILRCPDDNTAVNGKGNLSYAVNGGFARWPALPVAWEGSEIDGMSSNGTRLNWAPKGDGWQASQAVGKKLGVMFLGTHTGGQPWDIRTSAADISDGANSTILVAENRLTGYSAGESPYSGHQPTNWACPFPNFAMIFGSDEVCRSARGTVDCLAGQLAPRPDGSPGIGWKMANRNDTLENVGGGEKLRFEGSYPFSNAHHPPRNSLFWSGAGANYAFCDGTVRFITNTIDGDVYARILTPAGASLPPNLRQAPLPAQAFEP